MHGHLNASSYIHFWYFTLLTCTHAHIFPMNITHWTITLHQHHCLDNPRPIYFTPSQNLLSSFIPSFLIHRANQEDGTTVIRDGSALCQALSWPGTCLDVIFWWSRLRLVPECTHPGQLSDSSPFITVTSFCYLITFHRLVQAWEISLWKLEWSALLPLPWWSVFASGPQPAHVQPRCW